jgi:hypothetical protein
MKNPGDNDAVFVRLIEDDVLALLKTPDTGEDRIAGPTQARRIGQQLEAPCQLLNVVLGLPFAPGIDGVTENFRQIGSTLWSQPVGAQAAFDFWRLDSALRWIRSRISAITVGPSR